MATAEELLNSLSNTETYSDDPGIFVINDEDRTIDVPSKERLFGVTGDKDVERKYFQCPKIVGDNIDLSQHQIYISYVFTTSENNTIFPTIGNGRYHCEDVEVSGENITFSWLLSGNVLSNPGFIAFKVMAMKNEGDELKTKWNTAPAFGTVLITVPDGEDIAEEYPDVINQIFDRLDALESGGGGGTGGTTNYENLSNKPQLNGVTLEGNKTLDQVGVLAKNQGSNNSGKFLSVGSDGNVVPADAPSGGTVDTEQIKQAVNGYLEENPVSGMTAEQKQQLEQNTKDITDLRSAISNVDNIRPLVVNLVSCLKNVAWVKQNGQDYVNDLIDSFYGTSEGNTNKKWTYISSYNKKLSEYDYLSASIPSVGTEEIKDAFLHLFLPKGTDGNNPIRYYLKDEVTNDAKLTARVRFNSIPISSAGSGFRLQLSNGISGAQLFQYNNNYTLNFLVYEGSNHIIKNEIKLKKWYEISVELSAGYQVVSIDGAEILRSNVLSTNYCNKNSIILQNALHSNQVDSDVDIEWISYESAEA